MTLGNWNTPNPSPPATLEDAIKSFVGQPEQTAPPTPTPARKEPQPAALPALSESDIERWIRIAKRELMPIIKDYIRANLKPTPPPAPMAQAEIAAVLRESAAVMQANAAALAELTEAARTARAEEGQETKTLKRLATAADNHSQAMRVVQTTLKAIQ